jgi:hypothetical protein
VTGAGAPFSEVVLGKNFKGIDISNHPILRDLIAYENQAELTKLQVDEVFQKAGIYAINFIIHNRPLFDRIQEVFQELYDPYHDRKKVTTLELSRIFSKFVAKKFKVNYGNAKPGIYNHVSGNEFAQRELQRLNPDVLSTKAIFLKERLYSAVRFFGLQTQIEFEKFINGLTPPVEPVKK